MTSIVVPLLNECAVVPALVDNLRRLEGHFEVIAVDGGSTDGTVGRFETLVSGDPRFKILSSDTVRGRSAQMNLGAAVASGDSILFLHADCKLPPGALLKIEHALCDLDTVGGGFYKSYEPETFVLWLYRVIANIFRTKLMRNFVGTNAIFVRKVTFIDCGRYPAVPILEDVLLNDRLKKWGRLVVLRPHVTVSSRRYLASGTLRRIWIAVMVIFLFRIRKMELTELADFYQKTLRKNKAGVRFG